MARRDARGRGNGKPTGRLLTGRPGGALVLAVVLLFAGCNGLAPGSGSADSPASGTVTPAPVPEGAPDASAVELVPGLSNEGVTAPTVLAEGHGDTLAATSYTLHSNRSITGPDGTLRTTNWTLRMARNASRYRVVKRFERANGYPVDAADAPRVDLWWAGERTVIRLQNGNRVRVIASQPRTQGVGGLRDPTNSRRLAQLLTGIDLRLVASESTTDSTRYRLAGNRESLAADVLRVPLLLTDPRNVRLAVDVADAGYVRRATLTYDATYRNRTVRVRWRFSVERLGTTHVERPDWTRNATTTALGPADGFRPGRVGAER